MSALKKYEDLQFTEVSIFAGEMTGMASSTCIKADLMAGDASQSAEFYDEKSKIGLFDGVATGLISSTC